MNGKIRGGCIVQVFEVAGHAVKPVMNQLLKGSAFDGFLVCGAEISVLTKIEISGILDKNYFPEEERANLNRNYVYWGEIKPFVLSLIKGGRTPSALKIVFSATDDGARALHENASSLFLNLLYEENKLRFTTAISQRSFSLDKSADAAWEQYIKRFLDQNGWAVSTPE